MNFVQWACSDSGSISDLRSERAWRLSTSDFEIGFWERTKFFHYILTGGLILCHTQKINGRQ